MLSNVFNTWDIICYMIKGVMPVVEMFFTMPLLPFTIFGIIGFFVKAKSHR